MITISAVQHTRTIEENEDDPSATQTESRRRRSISCGGEGRRVRRSCVIIPSPPPEPTDQPRGVRFQIPDNLGLDGKYFFPNQTPNYNLTMYESSCLYWDEKNENWTGDGCKVSHFIVAVLNKTKTAGNDESKKRMRILFMEEQIVPNYLRMSKAKAE